MDKNCFFEKNLLALSKNNPALCAGIARAAESQTRYQFLESRSGETVPALLDSQGTARPLHSTVDPKREARRLMGAEKSGGFLILPGLGGGFYAEAALEAETAGKALVIEYGINGLKELLRGRDYSRLFEDPRFHLIADISGEELERQILSLYKPVLYGGIRVVPLRARTAGEPLFGGALNAIERVVGRTAADYSVQSHFGIRWFSGIIRNLEKAGEPCPPLPEVRRAAVSAAGPSLSAQMPLLKKKRKDFFLIATDTSLPCLLDEKIAPDAVISIDCQHISYYHFMKGLPESAFLFLDLASPPLLASLSKTPVFFSGGHPLAQYVSRFYRKLPALDVSGGNVTYAALSLAEQLGAEEIELYGADFSYPGGVSYARGSYIYSLFEKRQNRFSSLEAQASAFLFRTPLEKKRRENVGTETPRTGACPWYYETGALKFYRERLEEKAETLDAEIIPAGGLGAPLRLPGGRRRENAARPFGGGSVKPEKFSRGKEETDAKEFLERYKNALVLLPEAGERAADFEASLNGAEAALFTTMLPAAAALKHRYRQDSFRGLFERTKNFCLKEIELVKQRY